MGDVHIQAPFTRDGVAVRAYFANLSAASYLTEDEILVGAHHIEASAGLPQTGGTTSSR